MEKMLASMATTALATVSKMSSGENKMAATEVVNNESNQLFKSVLNKQVSAQQDASQHAETIKLNAKHALNNANHQSTIQKTDSDQKTVTTDEKQVSDKTDNLAGGDKSINKSEVSDAESKASDQEAKDATDAMLALATFSQPLAVSVKTDLSTTKSENTSQLISTDTAATILNDKGIGLANGNQADSLQSNQVNDKLDLANVGLGKSDLLATNKHNPFTTQLDAAKLQQEIGAEALAKKTDVGLEANLATMIAGADKPPSALATNALSASQLAASRPVIDAYPGKAGWDQAISQRVVYMVGAGEQSATLTLNPPDLGPLQVVVSVNNGQADASFTSDNAEVRQALQDGMDNLREKMRESGVQLGQTNVQSGEQSRQAFEQATQHRSSENRLNTVQSSAINPVDGANRKVAVKVLNGLVDTFA
jgi:flagellar hook-length control protein FliK